LSRLSNFSCSVIPRIIARHKPRGYLAASLALIPVQET